MRSLVDMEHLTRSFLWEANSSTKVMHHIAWDVIFRPKERGGLGFRSLMDSNSIALARLCWRMILNPQHLLSRVLIAKYGGIADLQGAHRKAGVSNT